MKKNNAFRRAAALLAALSITVSLAAPAFAGTYYIDDGDIIITKDENGRQTVKRSESDTSEIEDNGEIIITTREQTITTQESDLEGPAAEDSGFGPVVEDNYQPAQPEDAEEPEGADQPEGTDQPEDAEEPKAADRQENAEEQESADRQAQPQQAAPADAAPAAPAPVNPKGNGFFGNTITVINKAATALKLTLKDVKIDVSDTGKNTGIPGTSVKGKAALSVQGKGNVEIELDGDNELKSGFNRAGLEKNTFTSTGTLTLKDDNQKAGSLTATGGYNGAGIGGGTTGSGSNVTVSGAAQVTVTASKSSAWVSADTGATIGNGGSVTEDDDLVDGKEIQADISHLTTGYIHHIIYNLDSSIKREWWEPERPQPTPDGPNAPAEESNEVDLGTPWLHVETLEGGPLPFDAQQQGSTLRVTSDTLAARLHGTRQALEALQEQGVEQIQFVTTLKTTTLSVEDLLAEGGSWFALEHDGLASRQLSAAQAESLKCQMR